MSLSSCLSIGAANIKVLTALDFIFEQSWYFQDVIRTRVDRVLSVAPNETMRLSISTTQRKLFSRNTVTETESSENTEALITDRTALNATRSSTKTKNWQISGNASVSVPIKGAQLDFGLAGSLSKSASTTVSSTVDRVNEATQKSTKALRSLHKIDVTETTELTTQAETTRTIANPYRDRSMSVKVYGLGKSYNVDMALVGARPSIIIEILRLDFTRDFVLSHADFVDRYLIDQRLKFRFADVLETVLSPQIESSIAKSESIAKEALEFYSMCRTCST